MIRKIDAFCLSAILILLVSCSGQISEGIVQGPGGRTIKVSFNNFKCSDLVDYDSKQVGVDGVDVPIKIDNIDIPLKIGRVDVNPQILRRLSQVALIIDNHQRRTCEKALGIPDPTLRSKFLVEQSKIENQLVQLSLIVQASSTAQEFEKEAENWMKKVAQLGTADSQ